MSSGLGVRLVLRDPARSLIAIAGIAVAVLIAFVEIGFMNGVVDSHLRIIEAARGDIVVLDSRRTNLNRWDGMLAIRLEQIAALSGVASVVPVYQSGDAFRGAPGEAERRINVVAFPPEDPPFDLRWTDETRALLREPGIVLLDRLSRSIYGDLEPGHDVWLEGHRLRLGGYVELGPTIVIDGLLLMSDGTFRSMNRGARPRMAVVRVAEGASTDAVVSDINALAGDVRAYSLGALAERESLYLERVAPLGLLFGAGMIAGLFVGLVICYQVLYIAVRRRLKAFATVKAMGFSNAFVLRTVLTQALLMGVAGFVVGATASFFVYRHLARITGLMIELNWQRACAVALACLGACAIAGALAALKPARVPPAELF